MTITGTNGKFGKNEKLCSISDIDTLFKSGKTLHFAHFRLTYIKVESRDNITAKVLISIPKRTLKKAVDRNRMKRLIRESYRTNKSEIIDFFVDHNLHYHIAIIYTGNEVIDYDKTTLAIKTLLKRLIDTLNKLKCE